MVRTSVLVLALASFFAFAAAQQNDKDMPDIGKWLTKAAAWARKGNGQRWKGQQGKTEKSDPPQESITACSGLAHDDSCSFISPRNKTIRGQCKGEQQPFHCVPAYGRQQQGGQNSSGQMWNRGTQIAKSGIRQASAIQACKHLDEEDACKFSPPVWGDKEAKGRPMARGGNLRQMEDKGKEWLQRRGPPKGAHAEREGVCVPANKTVMGRMITYNWCRMLPPPRATTACDNKAINDTCDFFSNGIDTPVNLTVMTSVQPLADTIGDVVASFFVDGKWTDPEPIISGGIALGENASKVFLLPGWPTNVSLTTWSNDAWCFWKVAVNGTVILEDPAGRNGSDAYSMNDTFADSRYWIEGPPSSQIFDVPEANDPSKYDSQQTVTLLVSTSVNANAGTTGSVFLSFLVNGTWTVAEKMFQGAAAGEDKVKSFVLGAWPDKIWMSTDSSDAYSFWQITLDGEGVIEDPSITGGAQDYDPMSFKETMWEQGQFWIASPPSSQSFDIPAMAGARNDPMMMNNSIRGSCQEAWWDMMNGTLHCRPMKRTWSPIFNRPDHQGNATHPNSMQPDFNMKSNATGVAITLQMKIHNLDYSQLMQNRHAQEELTRKIQDRLAATAGQGVYSRHVAVTYSAGSVVVDASIDPPAYVSRSFVHDRLTTSTSLSSNVAADAMSIPDVAAMATGTLSVTVLTISVSANAVAAPEPVPAPSNKDKVKILVIVACGSLALALCMCVVSVCLCKRMKTSKRHLHINGTTIAVGQPVSQTNHTLDAASMNNVTKGTVVHPEEKGSDGKEASNGKESPKDTEDGVNLDV
jgi:hypothetical protein